MSSPNRRFGRDERSTGKIAGFDAPDVARIITLACAIALLGSFVYTLYGIATVVGGARWVLVAALGSLVAATVLVRYLTSRGALIIGTIALVAGLAWYLGAVPTVAVTAVSVQRIANSLLALLTGLSVLRILQANVWVIAIVPAPMFTTWLLVLRRRYALGAFVGAGALGFVVLTGDAGPTIALLGTTGALGVLGFGGADRTGITRKQLANVGLLLALGVVAARLFRIVPDTGRSAPRVASVSEGTGPQTLQGSLMSAGGEISIAGSISLSPAVRFTVTADEPSYWHVAAYDRYTGSGWVRTGTTNPYAGPLGEPPGSSREVTQTIRAAAPLRILPAAWKPTRLRGSIRAMAAVTDLGGLQPAEPLAAGDTYTVVSDVPPADAERLRAASGDEDEDYPDAVRTRYLELPQSTTDRLRRRAREITADAETDYDRAAQVRRWLERRKGYSLDIERPEGDIADAFVFEMDAGYCVYFATAMVALLRALDVPARFVVGYSTGQQVADDRWVARGFNSHAWVEVYFPDVGWVVFDPTPSGPRQAARQRRLDGARAAGESDVDTDETDPNATATTATTDSETTTTSTTENTPIGVNGGDRTPFGASAGVDRATPETVSDRTGTSGGSDTGTGGLPVEAVAEFVSNRDRVAVLASAIGFGFGLYRLDAVERGRKAFRLRYQPRTESPGQDVEYAAARLQYVLGRRYRERREDETFRQYLAALESRGLDARAYRVRDLYERARYANQISREEADTAVELVDGIVSEDRTKDPGD